MFKLQNNIEIKILEIVEDIVKYWKNIISDKSLKTLGGDIGKSALNHLIAKIKNAQKQITVLVPDREQRINLVEQTLLAIFDKSDLEEMLHHIALLFKLADDNLKLFEIPELVKKIRDYRGIKTANYNNWETIIDETMKNFRI